MVAKKSEGIPSKSQAKVAKSEDRSERLWTTFPSVVGYYWCDTPSGEFVIEISGGAPGVKQVVYTMASTETGQRKRAFFREWPGRRRYYGPLRFPVEVFEK